MAGNPSLLPHKSKTTSYPAGPWSFSVQLALVLRFPSNTHNSDGALHQELQIMTPIGLNLGN